MKEKLDKIFTYKYSYEIYCIINCIISLITWALLPNFGMILLMAIGSILLFIKKDSKMILPQTINLIFTIGSNFNSVDVPYGIIIGGTLLIISLTIHLIYNKKEFIKGKFFYPFLFLAILNIITIFWSAITPEYKNQALYLLYFNWALYLVIYLIIINLIHENIKKEFSIAMSYLAFLLTLECVIKGILVYDKFNNVFDLYYSLGWGICNEAGIMMCVSLPFIFYNFLIGDLKEKIISVIKLCIVVIGIFVTTSRATYLVALCEILLLAGYLAFISKHKKKFFIGITATIAVLLIILFAFGIMDDIMKYVFEGGLDLNGRDALYKKAIDHFISSPRSIIFGDGIANEFEFVASDLDAEFQIGTYRMMVYHSTLFETLAINGIIGLGLLIWHFVQKYKLFINDRSSYSILMLIGFISVDLYGLLDNTYHMYYYMIILVIILGVSEIGFKNKEEVNYEQ